MGLLGAILAAWLLAGGSFLGVGLLLLGFERIRPNDACGYFDAFWLGFAATVALLQIWHLVFAVNAWVVLVVAALGATGIISRRSWADLAAPGLSGGRVWLVAGALALAAFWLALMGLRPLEIYDAGLYHLQAIKWAGTYPSVPGLGNLHGRLAFNSSYFLVLAMVGQGPLVGEGYRATSGLLFLIFFVQVGVSIGRLARPQTASGADWLLALMALPTAATVGTNGLANTSTDLPIFPLQVLLAYQLLRWLNRPEESDSRWSLDTAAVLAATAVTIKLSSAGFAAGCFGLAVSVALTHRRVRQRISRTPPLVGLTIAGALLVGLVISGIVLSGYPFYPSDVGGLPVDWRVPVGQAHLDAQGIVLFARQPGPLAARVYAGWAWFPDWVAANAVDLASPTIAAVLGLVVTVATWPRTSDTVRRGLLLLLPVWAGLATWFFSAPAFRFAGALFWLAGAIPVAQLQAYGRARLTTVAVVAFILASVMPPQTEQLSLILRAPIAALRRGVTPLPVALMNMYVTNSGLQLYVPADTELAWDGPLPSTPKPDARLRLRCPDTLACGFVLDRAT